MKRLVYTLAIMSLLACNSKNTNTEGIQATTTSQLPTNPAAPNATTQQQNNAAGLLTNPAHGQPGHDCAIPVGAPLKQNISTSQTAPTPAPATTVPITTPPTAPQPIVQQPSSSSKKLNPAHGQPGHDCAIPVGAPLT